MNKEFKNLISKYFFEVNEFYWINKRNKIRIHGGDSEFDATDFSPEKLFLYKIRN